MCSIDTVHRRSGPDKPKVPGGRQKTILTLLVLTTTLLAQTPLQAFAGSWTAELKGQSLARLDFTPANGELQGQLGLAGMHLDENGNVAAVIPDAGHTAPASDIAVRDGVLSFAVKDDDDTDRFEVRLVDGRATLTMVIDETFRAELAREGIAVPIPIMMTRISR